MYPLIQLKQRNLFFIALGLVLLGLLPKAQAVSPAPDGGYPGGNTAEGQNALFSPTPGGYNTAVGYLSLKSDESGLFNTTVGAAALFFNAGGGGGPRSRGGQITRPVPGVLRNDP